METNNRIFVAGARGLAGSAIGRRLEAAGFSSLLRPNRSELDLEDRSAVLRYFEAHQPEYVFLAAARVGGILANSSYPVDFLVRNLHIQLNVFEAAHRVGVRKIQFLGSSCIYPKYAPQPMTEDALLSGLLEPTNEWYAIAKIAGIKMGQAYRQQYGMNAISLMPTNLYGPYDNFDLQSSHVLPALLRKFHEAVQSGAAQVTVWGSGTPRREFLHVDDLADAAVFLMQTYEDSRIINVGCGQDVSIAELAQEIASVTGFRGEIVYDSSKPDGAPRKLLDVSRLHSLGWEHKISLREGIESTYRWFVANPPSR